MSKQIRLDSQVHVFPAKCYSRDTLPRLSSRCRKYLANLTISYQILSRWLIVIWDMSQHFHVCNTNLKRGPEIWSFSPCYQSIPPKSKHWCCDRYIQMVHLVWVDKRFKSSLLLNGAVVSIKDYPVWIDPISKQVESVAVLFPVPRLQISKASTFGFYSFPLTWLSWFSYSTCILSIWPPHPQLPVFQPFCSAIPTTVEVT